MKFTRRNFIKTSGLTAIGVFGLASSPSRILGAKSFGADRTDALSLYSSRSFQQLVGTRFTIYGEDFAIAAQLREVQMFSPKNAKNGVRKGVFGKAAAECFSLIFLPSPANLKQDVYSIFHPTIGNFDLLLVPGENEQGSQTLAAVINRI